MPFQFLWAFSEIGCVLFLAAKCDVTGLIKKPGVINGNNFVCSGWSLNSGWFKNNRYLCSIDNRLKGSTQERMLILTLRLLLLEWNCDVMHCLCLKHVFQKLVVSSIKQMLPGGWQTEVWSLCVNSTRQVHPATSMKSTAGSVSISVMFTGPIRYPVNVACKSVLPFADRLGDPDRTTAYFWLCLVCVMVVSISYCVHVVFDLSSWICHQYSAHLGVEVLLGLKMLL